MKIGRPRKYDSASKLQKAIEKYFTKLIVTFPARDAAGEIICDANGEPVMAEGYLKPPSLSGLCLHLGIDRSTWNNYCNREQYPEFSEITAMARLIIENYLEEQLVGRKGNVQGIVFNLQNNYGWKAKQDVELSAGNKLDVKVSVIGDES